MLIKAIHCMFISLIYLKPLHRCLSKKNRTRTLTGKLQKDENREKAEAGNVSALVELPWRVQLLPCNELPWRVQPKITALSADLQQQLPNISKFQKCLSCLRSEADLAIVGIWPRNGGRFSGVSLSATPSFPPIAQKENAEGSRWVGGRGLINQT